MVIKLIYDKKLKGFKEPCTTPRSSHKMISTGNLIFDSVSRWSIEFKCKKCNELINIWNIKYDKIIKEVLKDNGIEE